MLQREEEAPVDAVVAVAGPQGAVHLHDPRAVRPPAPLPVLQSEQTRPQWVSAVHRPLSTVQDIGIHCALHSPVICVVLCDTMEYSTGKTLVETTITLLLAPRVEASRLIRITKRNRGAIYLIFQPECMGQSLMCCISPEDCGKDCTCHSNAKGNHEMVTPDHRHKGTVLTLDHYTWHLASGPPGQD